MAAQPIVLNGVEFNSQQQAIAYFQEMLNRYTDGQIIVGADHDMLLALLQRHPDADQKIGCGVRRFYRDKTDKPYSCFWLERTDGSKTDFSYRMAIRGKKKSLSQEFSAGCRSAIQADLQAYRARFFEEFADAAGRVRCQLTGEPISLYESHVDHEAPLTFQRLVADFIAENQLEITPEMLSTVEDQQFQTTIVDAELREQFRRYHNEKAKLRVIKAQENLRLPKSGQ